MNTLFALRDFTTRDGLSLSYRDYPAFQGTAVPVLCLHGLTRNSEDFDDLAPHLARTRRVLTLDVRGRGRSQYDPQLLNYHPGTYAADVIQLLELEQIPRVIVVGTSMGGLIAMRLATLDAQQLAGVVLNDVGPEIAPAGLRRLQSYVGKLRIPTTVDQAQANTRIILGSAVPDGDPALWEKLTQRTYRRTTNGVFEQKSDPAIGQALAAGAGHDEPGPWLQFAALREVPTLCLRGEHSDILNTETLRKMAKAKPDLVVHTVANRGHAPLLDEPDALSALDRFLGELP